MNDYFDETVVRITNLGCERQRKLEVKPKRTKKSKIKSKNSYNGKKYSKFKQKYH